MNKILFINACVRPNSRTLNLAKAFLEKQEGKIEQVDLYQLPLEKLDLKGLKTRDKAVENNDFSNKSFDLAKQFASADVIVIAAPYWDMMFPSVLKTYLENITVCGLTFKYSSEGEPQGMCKAKSLYYITTAGGFIGENDFGFSYIKALAQNFFHIPNTYCVKAEGLDIFGADVEEILKKAKMAKL